MPNERNTIDDVHYDPDTGRVTWCTTGKRRQIGEPAGSLLKSGYWAVSMGKRLRWHHQIAFIKMTGKMPRMIDHINRDKTDNRWCNLRPCTIGQNMANQKLKATNTSGSKGVHKRGNIWIAQIGHEGERYELVRTRHKRIAELCYENAARLFKGDFAYAPRSRA